ncbi:MAG: MBL fold metallo-hydrolase [Clostridiales bacterium]|nr:MBL fold metallo-hydrolase [Clostridiales bacterium]
MNEEVYRVIKLRYGNTNTYLIQGEKGSILIDTDFAGTLPAFYKAIKTEGIQVSDITYVMATHYHPDHMGLISELQSQSVKLVLLENQVDHIHFSDAIFERIPNLSYTPIDASQALVLAFSDAASFLADLGIEGTILPTKSHSEDGIAIVLSDGTAIVGDLEPISYMDGYSDNAVLADDWKRILDLNPKHICHAHANDLNL